MAGGWQAGALIGGLVCGIAWTTLDRGIRYEVLLVGALIVGAVRFFAERRALAALEQGAGRAGVVVRAVRRILRFARGGGRPSAPPGARAVAWLAAAGAIVAALAAREPAWLGAALVVPPAGGGGRRRGKPSRGASQGFLDPLLLMPLRVEGESHAAALADRLRELTGGVVDVSEAGVYTRLRALKDQGLLGARPAARRIVRYAVNALGEHEAARRAEATLVYIATLGRVLGVSTGVAVRELPDDGLAFLRKRGDPLLAGFVKAAVVEVMGDTTEALTVNAIGKQKSRPGGRTPASRWSGRLPRPSGAH